MARKAFRVQVELEIQSITCPGVWLCPSGKVSLQLFMLDSCIQTAPQPPVFPLYVNERFVFYKTFGSVHKLSDLQKVFNKECLYAELIQWQDCEVGNVLSTFETSLSDMLLLSSCDVDLLMESSKNFPGIISPKIEICTKTTIDEVCTTDKYKTSSYVVNPKTLPSREGREVQNHRQKKVCHSVTYHRKQAIDSEGKKDKKPPFISCPRLDESLISRKVQGLTSTSCPCETKKKVRRRPLRRCPVAKSKISPRKSYSDEFLKCNSKHHYCRCTEGHTGPDCKICENYKRRFENFACPCPAADKVHPKIHPFKKQIETRSMSPCRKCLAEAEQSHGCIWCPYYGTPCSANKTIAERIRNLTAKIQDHLANNGCDNLRMEKENCLSDEGVCEVEDASQFDDDLEECNCPNLYSYNRRKFTDSLGKFYDSMSRKIHSTYDRIRDDDCECCKY